MTSIHVPLVAVAPSAIGDFPRHGLILKVMEEAGLDQDDSVVDAVLRAISPQLDALENRIETLATDLLTQQWQDAMDYQSMVNDVRSIR